MAAIGKRSTLAVCKDLESAASAGLRSSDWASSTTNSRPVSWPRAKSPTRRTKDSNTVSTGVVPVPVRTVVLRETIPKLTLRVTSFSSLRNSRPSRRQGLKASGRRRTKACNASSLATAWCLMTAQCSSLPALSATHWAATVLPTPLSPTHAWCRSGCPAPLPSAAHTRPRS
jgi:hypothetical protein